MMGNSFRDREGDKVHPVTSREKEREKRKIQSHPQRETVHPVTSGESERDSDTSARVRDKVLPVTSGKVIQTCDRLERRQIEAFDGELGGQIASGGGGDVHGGGFTGADVSTRHHHARVTPEEDLGGSLTDTAVCGGEGMKG